MWPYSVATDENNDADHDADQNIDVHDEDGGYEGGDEDIEAGVEDQIDTDEESFARDDPQVLELNYLKNRLPFSFTIVSDMRHSLQISEGTYSVIFFTVYPPNIYQVDHSLSDFVPFYTAKTVISSDAAFVTTQPMQLFPSRLNPLNFRVTSGSGSISYSSDVIDISTSRELHTHWFDESF